MRTLIRTLFTFALTLSTPAVAFAAKHALLVGIADYAASGLPSLDGPHNDVAITRELLLRRFGFAPKEIRVIEDAQATHTALAAAFARLANEVRPGDLVYIHYSGHGSLTRDLNGDERSGQDQTWVSFGARTQRKAESASDLDGYDVLDDELNAWLAPILAKTDHVVFVSDSCHSASVTRGRGPKVRAVPGDRRAHPLGRAAPVGKVAAAHVIRIGAARDVQSAAEFRAPDGARYGRFTWHWVAALENATPTTTWYEAFQQAATQLRAHWGTAQEPQLEGNRQSLVLGGELAAPARTVAIQGVRRGGQRATLAAGALAGMTRGSVFGVRAAEKQTPPARLEVTDVWAMDSGVRVLSGSVAPGDLAVEERHAYPFEPVRVFLNADFAKGVDGPLLERLAAMVQALPDHTLALSQADADLVLYVVRPVRDAAGQPIYSDPAQTLPAPGESRPPEVWVLTPAERQVHPDLEFSLSDPERGLQALRENLERLTRVREVKALGNSSRVGPSGPNLVLRATLLVPDADCAVGADCIDVAELGRRYRVAGRFPVTDMPRHQLVPDELLAFTIENRCPDKDYYVYLLEIAPNGAISAIFPRPEDRGEVALIPAGNTLDLYKAGYALRLEESGEEVIKVIASRQPIDVGLLEQRGYQALLAGRETRRGGLNPLERLLVNAVHGTRGVAEVRNDEWGTEQVVLPVSTSAVHTQAD